MKSGPFLWLNLNFLKTLYFRIYLISCTNQSKQYTKAEKKWKNTKFARCAAAKANTIFSSVFALIGRGKYPTIILVLAALHWQKEGVGNRILFDNLINYHNITWSL